MNRELFQPVLAILLGTGIGGLLCVAGQRQLNIFEVERCFNKPTHQLITIRTWIGTAQYCIHKKYLK
jgi:hypothetical protein